MVSLLLLNNCDPLRAVSPVQGCPSGAALTAPSLTLLAANAGAADGALLLHRPALSPADEQGRGCHCPPRTSLCAKLLQCAVCWTAPHLLTGSWGLLLILGGLPSNYQLLVCHWDFLLLEYLFCC